MSVLSVSSVAIGAAAEAMLSIVDVGMGCSVCGLILICGFRISNFNDARCAHSHCLFNFLIQCSVIIVQNSKLRP